jgi:hypothetical protein
MGVMRAEERSAKRMAPPDAVREPIPVSAGEEPLGAAEPGTGDRDDRNDLIRRMGAVLANVAVLTALLVYFGWTRSEVYNRRIGIDESILGMSTRDYLLRSVRPVQLLLIVLAVVGLLWLLMDRWLLSRLQANGPYDRVLRWSLRLLPAGLIVLPLTAWLAGFIWAATAFIAFPLCLVAGLLLVLYAFHLRQLLPGAQALPAGREALLRGFTAIIVGIGLFWAATNYATVEGTELAESFLADVTKLPSVVVYSPERLHINAPGAKEQRLPPKQSMYKYRYVGLRLLEHTGGRYFLISEGWSPRYGVVVMLADDDPVRLEFVRDRRF